MMKKTVWMLKKACLLSLLVIFASAQLLAQKVAGVVTDESNAPIPGVSVVVKGTTIGTVTGSDGSYSVIANDIQKDVLVFSFVGMERKEVAINGQTTVNVLLTSSTLELDEVVAIGYGTTKKRDLTGGVLKFRGKAFFSSPYF